MNLKPPTYRAAQFRDAILYMYWRRMTINEIRLRFKECYISISYEAIYRVLTKAQNGKKPSIKLM